MEQITSFLIEFRSQTTQSSENANHATHLAVEARDGAQEFSSQASQLRQLLSRFRIDTSAQIAYGGSVAMPQASLPQGQGRPAAAKSGWQSRGDVSIALDDEEFGKF